jgi:hypothetical protein
MFSSHSAFLKTIMHGMFDKAPIVCKICGLLPCPEAKTANQKRSQCTEYRRFEKRHAEYPALSVGENFSPCTAGHMALIPMRTTASPGGSQSTVVYPRILNRQRRAGRQLLFVDDNARTLTWLVTSNLAFKNNTLSLSTLHVYMCRRRYHASEVKQLFSTRSVSDVSWGKVRSLTA